MGAVNTPTAYRISARGCGVSATPGRTNLYYDTPKGLLIFGGRGAQRIYHHMIHSLLDNDLYKFTMMAAVWSRYRSARVCYRFINRNPRDRFPNGFA